MIVRQKRRPGEGGWPVVVVVVVVMVMVMVVVYVWRKVGLKLSGVFQNDGVWLEVKGTRRVSGLGLLRILNAETGRAD
jgi:hypothetical protein